MVDHTVLTSNQQLVAWLRPRLGQQKSLGKLVSVPTVGPHQRERVNGGT